MTLSGATTRRIPIIDLGKEYEAIQPELAPILDRLFRSGAFILGSELQLFERELAAYNQTRYAIGVNSGTDSILLALRALGIGPGQEVVLPATSFFATVEPVLHLGARPVFVDIDPSTYAMNAALLAGRLTTRTRAILVVHLYGLAADMKSLVSAAESAQLPLVEDVAQAIGGEFEGRKVGSFGALACLSFYPTKNLGACGDGGAVLTSSDGMADKIRSLRNHGAKIKYQHEEVGYNSRLDEIQAAILRLKLKRLDAWNEKRRDRKSVV
jgi:dTDP-4-amino-4,6-dideoxygalactose transaminase